MVRVRMPRIFGLVLRNPRDSLCAVALTLAVTAIVTNGLYLQPDRHPAPIFAVRPPPVRFDDATATANPRTRPPDPPRPDLTRPDLARSDPPRPDPPRSDPPRSDPPPRSDTAQHNPVPLPRPRQNAPPPPPRADPAYAEGVNPSWQVSLVQRTLNQAGYGPIKVSGILDDSTREGIARFERDHNLPVTGQNTARVRHALGALTGHVLD